ncbi:PREDICTED: uncharacterized protein LOC108559041 [Nicrophorus vespilloides]|uniref:Uncharacterized protein LOC108559041 n=1 Tax=Nicrophorus vespilloides TaxID=110193 RepID=A0ABM1MAR0_NICVS|nr:PREDICTED: uncharacterized protein LOC108559041 [Nicrophorus vespilloides]XP_017771661.1 PREDICTED: uncharacterized protein LOC108559041 [Nicrophorus vespilloides]
MAFDEDILQPISLEDLPKLRDLYKDHMPFATHVFSFFNTSMKWIKSKPEEKYMTFLAPFGDWKSDGTFIVILQSNCYDLFMFTLDNKCEKLYKALKETKKIDWNNMIQFYFVHREHCPIIYRVIKELQLPITYDTKTDLWWLPREKALKFQIDCPPEVYIGPLKPYHAPLINSIWPHRFPGSEGYLTTFIKMNGGRGLFLKSNDKLVAWVLKNQLGTLVVLQTLHDYKRKGYGSLVTAALSREIAEEGHNVIGTVLVNNSASQAMFKKLGFDILDYSRFIGVDGRKLYNHL